MNKSSSNQENDSKSPKLESKRPSQKLYVPKHMRNSNANGGGVNGNSAEVLHSNGDASLNNSINKMNFDDPSIVGYVTSGSLSTNFRNTLRSHNFNDSV